MEFEEILFPSMYVGKKKYCGIIHKKFDDNQIINTIDNYTKYIFIKGLDFKKKNMAKIISTIGYKFLETAFSIDNKLQLDELIYKSINDFYNT